MSKNQAHTSDFSICLKSGGHIDNLRNFLYIFLCLKSFIFIKYKQNEN